MRISDWSSDVCSSDLPALVHNVQRPVSAVEIVRPALIALAALEIRQHIGIAPAVRAECRPLVVIKGMPADIDHRIDRARSAQSAPARLISDTAVQSRSEEHTSELQSLMRISYAVFCLKKENTYNKHHIQSRN